MAEKALRLRIAELEQELSQLKAKIDSLKINTEEKFKKPTSVVGANTDRSTIKSIDPKTGKNQLLGGAIAWNNVEAGIPPVNQEPDLPTIGYNKHSHSRYSGGALINDVLEIVEYVWGAITNKHSQSYYPDPQPTIAKTTNSRGEVVEKIGLLDLVFNPDIAKWGTTAYEIDVKKCFLVQRDINGNIELDANGNEMKSPLWNADNTKTAVIWDINAKVWRIYATYAPGV